jgi:hypothetical protein
MQYIDDISSLVVSLPVIQASSYPPGNNGKIADIPVRTNSCVEINILKPQKSKSGSLFHTVKIKAPTTSRTVLDLFITTQDAH